MKGWITTMFYVLALVAAQAQADSVLSETDFMNLVRSYHPIAKQANLVVQKAEAGLLASRGMFDPVAAVGSSNKTFDGKNYFYYTNPELKVPTWFGADIKAGLENNGGQFLSSEESASRSSYIGFEMPLLKGLAIDKRRAAVQQAKIYRQQSEQERLAMLNDLFYDAIGSYWNWAGASQLLAVINRFTNNAAERVRLVKVSVENGDRAAIDSIEATAQLLSFQILQTEAAIKVQNTAIDLSNFLWTMNESSYQLPDNIKPAVNLSEGALQSSLALFDANNINTVINTHPSLQTYTYKLNDLKVEQRLKFQNLLPTFNVKYNWLTKGYDVFKGVNAGLFENNYKFGLDVKLPLFLREGRGDYRKAKLKIQETQLEQSLKRTALETKVKTTLNEASNLLAQINITARAYNSFSRLLAAEETRFRNGESSLFLINTRENKVLETLQKLIDLKTKWYKNQYAIQWSAGLLR
jgi:outer membrane protein TolC